MIVKKVNKLGPYIKERWEAHPSVVLLTIGVFLLSALLTVDTSARLVIAYLDSNIFWKNVETAKINKLAPVENIEYIESVLGTPIVTDTPVNGYKSYTFRGRQYWVYVIAKQDTGKAVYVATTACGNFHPILRNNPGGPPIQLGTTSLDRVMQSTSASTYGNIGELPPQSDRHYYIPAATAPLGIFDKYYLANPGRHQTIYAGFNAACKESPNIEPAILNKLADFTKKDADKLTSDELINFRSRLKVNTFAVTSNDGDSNPIIDYLDKEIEIGVNSKSVEILDPLPAVSPEQIKQIQSRR